MEMSDTYNFLKLMTFSSPEWFLGQQRPQSPDSHRRADPASPWNIINYWVWLINFIHSLLYILCCLTYYTCSVGRALAPHTGDQQSD